MEGFCTQCGASIESFENLKACPKCNTKSIPCSYKNQVKVDINIHELRILCMWAERWVSAAKNEQEQASMAASIRGIVTRLTPQVPEGTKLLLSDEFQALKKDFDVETNMTTI